MTSSNTLRTHGTRYAFHIITNNYMLCITITDIHHQHAHIVNRLLLIMGQTVVLSTIPAQTNQDHPQTLNHLTWRVIGVVGWFKILVHHATINSVIEQFWFSFEYLFTIHPPKLHTLRIPQTHTHTLSHVEKVPKYCLSSKYILFRHNNPTSWRFGLLLSTHSYYSYIENTLQAATQINQFL